MSLLLKHRTSINIIINRCLSSKQPTLFETLQVIEDSTDVFIQPPETLFLFPNRKSVFGGQLIGSAVYAAQKTLTKNYPLHSLHSYFLTAADNLSAITYKVARLRDGKSFETRSVTARQDNNTVFECAMNFHKRERGIVEHQYSMPFDDITPPEKLPSIYEQYQKLLDDKRLKPKYKPFVELALQMPVRIDMRYCYQRDLLQPEPRWPARDLVWMKSMDPLPDDPHIHRSALAYCSDRVLLGSAFLPFELNSFSPRVKMQASLDHSMWFHDDFWFDETTENDILDENISSTPIRQHPNVPPTPTLKRVRADDWLLYEIECPIHRNNRAWTSGRVWTRNGRLIVTCAQEGVIRCQ